MIKIVLYTTLDEAEIKTRLRSGDTENPLNGVSFGRSYCSTEQHRDCAERRSCILYGDEVTGQAGYKKCTKKTLMIR